MSIVEGIGRRLDQSARMMEMLGISLAQDMPPRHVLHNVVLRCALCRHGQECRDWLQVERREAPEFCANRDFFRQRAKSAAAAN